jgi:hypothetical protein
MRREQHYPSHDMYLIIILLAFRNSVFPVSILIDFSINEMTSASLSRRHLHSKATTTPAAPTRAAPPNVAFFGTAAPVSNVACAELLPVFTLNSLLVVDVPELPVGVTKLL